MSALLAALLAASGVTLNYQTPDGAASMQLDPEHLRREEGARVTIFDGQRMIEADAEAQAYQVADPAAMKASTAKVRSQMDAMLSSLPPDQRAAAQKSMRVRTARGRAVTFQRAEGGDSAAGVACDWYRVIVDGAPSGEESCFAPWERLGVAKSDFPVFEKIAAFAKSMAEMAGGGAGFAGRFERAPGAALVEARVKDGQRTERRRLVSIERGPIAADRFAPPAGYREVPMGQLRGRPR